MFPVCGKSQKEKKRKEKKNTCCSYSVSNCYMSLGCNTDGDVCAGGQQPRFDHRFAFALDARQQRCHHLPVAIHLRKLESLDLATRRSWNFLDKNDPTVQGFVARQVLPSEFVNLFGRQSTHSGVTRSHYKGARYLSSAIFHVHTGHSGVSDARVLEENSFDLSWGNLPSVTNGLAYQSLENFPWRKVFYLPSHFDELLGSPHNKILALLHVGDIAGAEPSIGLLCIRATFVSQ